MNKWTLISSGQLSGASSDLFQGSLLTRPRLWTGWLVGVRKHRPFLYTPARIGGSVFFDTPWVGYRTPYYGALVVVLPLTEIGTTVLLKYHYNGRSEVSCDP